MDTDPRDSHPTGPPDAEAAEGPLLLSTPPSSEAVSDEAVPDEAVPDEAVPEEAVPDEAVPDDRLVGTADVEPTPHRWRRWVVLATGLVGIIALVVAVIIGINANHQVRRTDASLDHSRVELHYAVALLASARGDLARAIARNNAAGTTLTADTAALDSVQAQLAKAQANESEQGVNISDLDTCLSGVEQALNEISLSDQSGAATTLGKVASACSSAEPTS